MNRMVWVRALACAVLFSVAAAATPQASATATMQMGHCPDQAPSRHSKAGFTECTMACAASLPAMDSRDSNPLLIPREPVLPAIAQGLQGLHPETATPPPKRS